MNKFYAVIEMTDGRRLPVFAGRKSVCFKSIAKAVSTLERKRIAGRGIVYPAGTTLADADWRTVFTIAL